MSDVQITAVVVCFILLTMYSEGVRGALIVFIMP